MESKKKLVVTKTFDSLSLNGIKSPNKFGQLSSSFVHHLDRTELKNLQLSSSYITQSIQNRDICVPPKEQKKILDAFHQQNSYQARFDAAVDDCALGSSARLCASSYLVNEIFLIAQCPGELKLISSSLEIFFITLILLFYVYRYTPSFYYTWHIICIYICVFFFRKFIIDLLGVNSATSKTYFSHFNL